MPSRSSVRYALTLTAILAAISCGSGQLDVGFPTGVSTSGGGGGTATSTAASYDGAVADSTRHGHLSLIVSATNTITGSILFSSGLTVTLTGAIDTVTQVLNVTGGGYVLSASPSSGTLQGTYSGPAGTSVGYFVATSDSLTQQTHTLYCGTYTSTNGNGWFGMDVLGDGDTGGFSVQTLGGAASQVFTGTLLNGGFTGQTNLGAAITGILSGSTISGSYAPPIGSTAGTGTFTVSAGSC